MTRGHGACATSVGERGAGTSADGVTPARSWDSRPAAPLSRKSAREGPATRGGLSLALG